VLRNVAQSLAGRLGYEVRRTADAPDAHQQAPPVPFDEQQRLLTAHGLAAPVIFDVGANRGETAGAYRARFPQARIYCFEPFPACVEALRHRYERDPLITVLPLAVADRAGARAFHVTGRDDQNSLLPRPSEGRRYYPSGGGIIGQTDVQAVTLDEIVQSGQTPAPDILKFDIQGGELLALQGATALLRAGRVLAIYCEVWFIAQYEGSPLFRDVWAFLEGFGYTVYSMHNLYTASNGQLRVADVLFVSDALRRSALNTATEEP
jgi:FkbM family methyltransferase